MTTSNSYQNLMLLPSCASRNRLEAQSCCKMYVTSGAQLVVLWPPAFFMQIRHCNIFHAYENYIFVSKSIPNLHDFIFIEWRNFALSLLVFTGSQIKHWYISCSQLCLRWNRLWCISNYHMDCISIGLCRYSVKKIYIGKSLYQCNTTPTYSWLLIDVNIWKWHPRLERPYISHSRMTDFCNASNPPPNNNNNNNNNVWAPPIPDLPAWSSWVNIQWAASYDQVTNFVANHNVSSNLQSCLKSVFYEDNPHVRWWSIMPPRKRPGPKEPLYTISWPPLKLQFQFDHTRRVVDARSRIDAIQTGPVES